MESNTKRNQTKPIKDLALGIYDVKENEDVEISEKNFRIGNETVINGPLPHFLGQECDGDEEEAEAEEETSDIESDQEKKP